MPRKKLQAELKQVLVDYDGPQLLLLRSERNRDMLAVAVERDGMALPFFTCEIRQKTVERYFREKVDLRYALEQGHRHYFFDLAQATSKTVTAYAAGDNEWANEKYWPEPGIFSSTHTNPYQLRDRAEAARAYNIDGRWEASDFSHFQAKLSDLYAFFGALNHLNSSSVFARFKELIQGRFWKGGGSYLGFYDKLFDNIHTMSPLDVKKIEYASPGVIVFSGDEDIFGRVSDVVEVFTKRHDELENRYRNLHGLLSQQKLLRARPNTRFASKDVQTVVHTGAIEMAKLMNVQKIDKIFEACSSNTLVFAKVILSLHRRVRELYDFEAEGRVRPSADDGYL